MIHIRCRCGERLRLAESALGTWARCPACRRAACAVADGASPMTDDFDYCLVVERGQEFEGRAFYLGRHGTVGIGKTPNQDIALPGSEVSRKHCCLTRTARGWRAEDRASTNGLRVNGERVRERDLQPGDVIGVGEYRLKFMSVDRLRPGTSTMNLRQDLDD